MSLIHWDKSVLSFHLKEMLEDHNSNEPIALIGLGAIAVGTLALPAIAKLGKPVAKAVIKRSLAVSPAPTASYRPVEAKFPTTLQRSVNSQQ
jgi:hypothetical protein